MRNLVPINKIRRGRVQGVIKRALRSGLDVSILEDFLTSVDWSGTDRERPEIANNLGQLEGLNWEYSRGDLTKSQYVACLLSFLPEKERDRHLFLDGGLVEITVVRRESHLAPPPQLARYGDQPQTGSRAQPDLVAGVSRSDTVLAL